MTIEIENEYAHPEVLDFDWDEVLRQVIEGAVDYAKCPYEVQVNVLLTDNESIHRINMEQRQIDRPTDVLSFPMVNYETPGDFDVCEEDDELFDYATGELLLGDIVISVDKVLEQAEAYGHTTKRELAFLAAHSMFHLFGYDHMEETERTIMEEKQKDLMNLLGITR